MTYSRIKLADLSASQPAPIPMELIGLADQSLADLPAALNPVPKEWKGVGFWPVDEVPISFDPRARTRTGVFDLAIDETAKRVTATPQLRDLTPEEIGALPPLVPKTLGKLEFIGLAQSAGGMTDAMLVEAYKDPRLEALWVKYQMASDVKRDHEVTTQALAALDALGYLPKGAAKVVSAWPLA